MISSFENQLTQVVILPACATDHHCLTSASQLSDLLILISDKYAQAEIQTGMIRPKLHLSISL
jgi:hypothetical protein